MSDSPKKIVILGAGFGGLHIAIQLGKALKKGMIKNHEVILIDKNNYHTYTPTLYEAATTSKEVANAIGIKSIITFPVNKALGKLPVRFVCSEINKLDIKNGDIHLTSGYNLQYDYLVIALGSVINDFGIPGLKDYALPFKTFTDAIIIRDAIYGEIAEGNSELKIVIGGGGSTGVELAGELKLWLNQSERKFKRHASVKIIEANQTVLRGFRKKVIDKVTARLKELGVELALGQAIKLASKKDREIHLADGEKINADIFIWAGGVKANDLIGTMPLKMNKGRAEVSDTMVCLAEKSDLTLAGKVFGIGDIVCLFNPVTGEPIQMVARAALLEASLTAKNIIREINGLPHLQYKPTGYPYIIPVGGKYAVASIGNIVISGLLAWILKGFVELNYLTSIMPVWRALVIWLKGLWIFTRNERLG